jgi:hypothetical protein
LRFEVVNTRFECFSSQCFAGLLIKTLFIGLPVEGVESGAIKEGVGVLGSARIHEDDIAIRHDIIEHDVEDAERKLVDVRLPGSAGMQQDR